MDLFAGRDKASVLSKRATVAKLRVLVAARGGSKFVQLVPCETEEEIGFDF